MCQKEIVYKLIHLTIICLRYCVKNIFCNLTFKEYNILGFFFFSSELMNLPATWPPLSPCPLWLFTIGSKPCPLSVQVFWWLPFFLTKRASSSYMVWSVFPFPLASSPLIVHLSPLLPCDPARPSPPGDLGVFFPGCSGTCPPSPVTCFRETHHLHYYTSLSCTYMAYRPHLLSPWATVRVTRACFIYQGPVTVPFVNINCYSFFFFLGWYWVFN
jgi:hypothetical protein